MNYEVLIFSISMIVDGTYDKDVIFFVFKEKDCKFERYFEWNYYVIKKKGQNSSTMGNIVKIENTDIKGSPSSSYGVSYGM